jgi:glycosyltransferase involved in cell wall biosynthesis
MAPLEEITEIYLKVIHVSTTDIIGGAGRSAYRLHKELQALGINSRMLVQEKQSEDPSVLGPQNKVDKFVYLTRPTIDMLPLLLVGKGNKPISTAWAPSWLAKRLRSLEGDITHLHWVGKGFLRIEVIKTISGPILWTLRDMWPMTGGCHHDFGCGRYEEHCGLCPRLESNHEVDLSRWIWQRKARAWRKKEFVIVCPSRWMADRARRSSLFRERRIEVIANGLDLDRFRPLDCQQTRDWLGLPRDKKLILFGALRPLESSFKGFPIFQQATQILADMGWRDRLEIVILGASRPLNVPDLAFKTHYIGHLRDELSLALVYGAMDVFAAPSIQDNLPSTVMEALACGTPCVGSNVGGIPEMIEQEVNGYLSAVSDAHSLAYGLNWILEDQERWHRLSQAARAKATRDFDQERQAKRYIGLYEELIDAHRRKPD